MFAALTATGLAAAAGLNAYIPFLIVALFARWTDIIVLPSHFAWIESSWAIGAAFLLMLVEVIIDKIPALDSVNDMVQTFVRPTVGGVIFAATQAAENLDNSQFMNDYPWLGVVAGILTALGFHAGKSAIRPAVNTGTAGVGGPVLSTIEDGFAISLSLVAIFAPVFVLAALAFCLWMAYRLYKAIKIGKAKLSGEFN